jgi:hypothetical protein
LAIVAAQEEVTTGIDHHCDVGVAAPFFHHLRL